MDNTDKLIKEQFDSLPLEIKESLDRVPWEDRVLDIAKREGLNDEKAGALKTETMLILFGFLSGQDYTQNIQREAGLDEEQAERISKLVNDEIFADLEKQYEMIEALAPKAANGPSAPPPQAKPEEKKKSLLDIPPEIMAKSIKMPEGFDSETHNLPMVEAGETAHEVPHVETPAPAAPATQAPAVPETLSPAPIPAPAPMAPQPAKIAAEGEIAPGKPKSIVEEKLSHIVVASNEAAKTAYQSGNDPYREPIE